jgi:hypothetical protein
MYNDMDEDLGGGVWEKFEWQFGPYHRRRREKAEDIEFSRT